MTPIQSYMLTKPFGFVTDKDMPEVIRLARLVPLLVRCGGKRFVAPAQDVAAMIKAVEASGDYVRDVSFPAQEMDAARAAQAAYKPKLIDLEARRQERQAEYRLDFDESQCGGVYDGHGVTSDADPGL